MQKIIITTTRGLDSEYKCGKQNQIDTWPGLVQQCHVQQLLILTMKGWTMHTCTCASGLNGFQQGERSGYEKRDLQLSFAMTWYAW